MEHRDSSVKQRDWIQKKKDEMLHLLELEVGKNGGKLEFYQAFILLITLQICRLNFEIIGSLDVRSIKGAKINNYCSRFFKPFSFYRLRLPRLIVDSSSSGAPSLVAKFDSDVAPASSVQPATAAFPNLHLCLGEKNELIDSAVKETLSVLKTCVKSPSVKRVVFTSSFCYSCLYS
ncbi:hypothetical protein RYX36_009607 [Vicia faba]